MKLVFGLDEIGDGDAGRFGGKAVALAALNRIGQPVPRTLCLTTEAYQRFVEHGSLRAVIQQELGRKSFEDMRWEEIWDVALRIRSRFLRARIPEEITEAVSRRLSGALSRVPLAVRSSAPGEDSGEASFAGLHDSFIGVQGVAAVMDAIRGVWSSLWTDRALLYRRELGIDVNTSAMAVVIQELVEGSTSGILFGIHPTDPEFAVVEAVYGLNQGLVDGTVEPDLWILDRATGRVMKHTPPAERRRLVGRGSQVVVETVPPELCASPPVDDAGLIAVFKAMQTTEALFGSPQDVEWTLIEGRLVLLQSRPVTTSRARDGDRRAWYLSLTRSLDNLRGLRERVERELLPAMDRETDGLASLDLASLDPAELVGEIERRRVAHEKWVEIYWREFIPLAHGIRLFGQFYNDVVRPEDPYEFMELLAATPMLSVRRNRELARLAATVRDDAELHSRLVVGERGNGPFERQIEEFEREFGGVAFGNELCFGDRERLIRFVLALANAPTIAGASSEIDVEQRTNAFISHVAEDRQELARELLDLGRASYRLRDDDNIHLARLKGLVLDAVGEGRRRVRERDAGGHGLGDLEGVVLALRNPNLVVEPRPSMAKPVIEEGFDVRPRQLVGQPAGPGVATAPARVVEDTADVFRFQAGEVLVCDAVDPNMTFVVPMASALVERRGGMLIHGAIIAREYGLPCVTGVPQATTLIADGDRLTVDGYLGIVTVARGEDRR